MSTCDIVTIESKKHKLGVPALLVDKQEFDSASLHKIAQDLQDTMNASKATGIAAPQIGINQQMIAYGGKPSMNFPDFNVPFTILINPTYQPVGDDKVTVWEHCLSLPGKRGKTLRHASIKFSGKGIEGKEIRGEAKGLHAVLLQHEIDHIQGKLFLSCVPNPAEYGDITHFEKTLGSDHHKIHGIQPACDITSTR